MLIGVAAGSVAVWFSLIGGIVVCLGVASGVNNLLTARSIEDNGSCPELRSPGECCYQTCDFATMDPAATEIANRVIDAVAQLRTAQARAWLDPDLPRAAHRLAWEVLCCLDCTRAARDLAAQLADAPEHAALAAALHDTINVIDYRLNESAQHLAGCVVLAHEWDRKLRDIDTRHRGDRELSSLQEAVRQGLATETESLLHNAFYRITAARDLTEAGPFPWEQPRLDWTTNSQVTHHLTD
ncbi:hypothetical protein [Amycolatopsis ultiminotia]|uniref:hypothetical protein n=1 Tax=Amycolatopsis ultiminotia TaxID=543629 RepID=UPI0031EBFB9F